MASDEITLKRIQNMHPDLRDEVMQMYLHANNKILGKGVRLRFSHTLRSFAEQDALYEQGRKFKGKIVTKAKGGQSYHNYGLAFDIVLLVDKDGDGHFETASWDTKADFDKDLTPDWLELAKYFKSFGWEWGGDWNKFPDYPHFQKTFGYTTSELRERKKGDYPKL